MSETPEPRIEVKNFVDRQELKKDIAFSTADLSSAMMSQASMYVHYGILAAHSSRQVDQFKTRLEIAESAVYRTLRDEAVKSGEKFSEPMLAAAVAAHKTIRAIKIAINEAKMLETIAKSAVEGFRHRRDMLVQQGILFREEMKGELTIAKRHLVEDQQDRQQDDLRQRLKQIDQAKQGA